MQIRMCFGSMMFTALQMYNSNTDSVEMEASAHIDL